MAVQSIDRLDALPNRQFPDPEHRCCPLRRQRDDLPTGPLRGRIIAKLALVSQLLHQARRGGDNIYSLHEPEADCSAKGKARVRHEFGCKVSIATTLEEGLVVDMRSFPGTPTTATPLL